MVLNELQIFNYKSCRNVKIEPTEGKPNIFIGLNDSGKTTILEAVNLLLNEKAHYNVKSESSTKNDLSNTCIPAAELQETFTSLGLPFLNDADSSTIILGKIKYTDEEKESFAAANFSNSLQWSIESNVDGQFWLCKVFSSAVTRTLLLFKEHDDLKLWEKAKRHIDGVVNEKNVTPEDIQNLNDSGPFSNMEKIRAIYEKTGSTLIWSEYKLSKDDRSFFPSFSLFDWNTSFAEINSTANAIMADIISQHISPLKSEANRLARQAEDEINQRFGELQETIKSVARSVTGIKAKMFFEVSEKVSDIMVTKENSDQEIHVDNQGEGLKRQIWFSLIKAKADENEGGPNMFIWAFDEPETHLHPSAQREFFDALKSLAKGNVQVLLGTHSTVFIDKSNLENISSISQDSSGYTMNSTCTSIEDVYGSLKLKNSDFLFYDKFLAIEGETEEHLIPRLYKLYKGRSLVDDNIQLIKMKGKSNWYETKLLLERLMNQFRKPVNSTYYLFDNDATRAIGAANKTDRMFFVGKQDIEDALTNEVWIRALNMYYDQEMTFDVDWLQEQRDKVLQGQDCPANKKMVRIIEDAIRKKWIDEGNEANTHKFLPKKADSADFLMSGINDLNDIPQVIRDCFDKL